MRAARLTSWVVLLAACQETVHLGQPMLGDESPPPDAGPAIPGYLHVVGSKIYDDADRLIVLKGVNWSGLEWRGRVLDGLHSRSLDSLLAQVAALGFNLIRIPYSSEAIAPGSSPTRIGAGLPPLGANPNLAGLTSLDVLDRVVDSAGQHGLRVILDRYRFIADDDGPPSATWYSGADPESADGGYPERRWIADWIELALRYADRRNVVGFDLHDEPGGVSRWELLPAGDSGADGSLDAGIDAARRVDWPGAAARAGSEILAVNPNLLIIVQGVEVVNGQRYWRGGNLRAARVAPVMLPRARLVYSIHEFGRSVLPQPWFSQPTYPDNLPALWEDMWGHLVTDDVAPVFVGAFGDRKNEVGNGVEVDTQDALWRDALATHMSAKQLSFSLWALNPSAAGKAGLLEPGWGGAVDTEWSSVLSKLLTAP